MSGAFDVQSISAPSAFYALFSRACFMVLRSDWASVSDSLERSFFRNASMIFSLGISRLLQRVMTLARVNVPSPTFALTTWYRNSLLFFISDSSIDIALSPLLLAKRRGDSLRLIEPSAQDVVFVSYAS